MQLLMTSSSLSVYNNNKIQNEINNNSQNKTLNIFGYYYIFFRWHKFTLEFVAIRATCKLQWRNNLDLISAHFDVEQRLTTDF